MTNLSVYFSSLSDASLDVRHAAVEKIAAAGRADPGTVVPAVVSELRSGTLDTRWYLGRSLVKMGPDIIPLILEYAEVEKDMDIQKYFGAVLASFGEIAVSPLVSLFTSSNPMARGMASAVLERLAGKAGPGPDGGALGGGSQGELWAVRELTKLNIFDYK